MATWDSAYLLALFNRRTQRPAVDPIADATKYLWLAEAQDAVVTDVAGLCPHVLYGAPQACLTADQKVFTFGVDADGNPVTPLGRVGVYPSLASIPDYPLVEGRDYLSEGSQIRIPNDRTYSGTLYWRGAVLPTATGSALSAAVAPALQPVNARVLIVIEAARAFMSANRMYDAADELQAEYNRTLPSFLLVWKRQFKSGGAFVPLVSDVSSVSGVPGVSLGTS